MEKEKILHLGNDISTILSTLMELKQKGSFCEALNKIDATLISYFNLDKEFTYTLSEKILIHALKEEKRLNSEQLTYLAEILSEKGDILLAQNKLKKSLQIFKNTLNIYYYINEDLDSFSFKNMNKMISINEKLAKINADIDIY